MIELSLGKMVLLALIALIVLGPEKLPGAARTAGALLRRVRSGWDNVRAEVERELEIEEIKRNAREAVASAEAAQQHVKNTLKDTHDPFAEAAAMVKLQPPSSSAPPKPDDMAPEARVTSVNMPTPSTPACESPLDAPDHAHTADDSAADRPLEGVQAELPLDEPTATPQQELPLHGDASHGHA
jgi:sec-independent protein translocase protein TatB